MKYEIKKLLSGKRNWFLWILAGLSIIYFTYMQSCSNSIGSSVPYDEYLGVNSYYGMLIFILSTLSVAYVFPFEEKSGVLQLLRVSYMRDKIVKYKIALILVITNILAITYIVTSVISYAIAFHGDFDIELYGDAVEYTVNPNIKSTGDVLFVMLITFFLSVNINALITVYFSIKTNNPFLISVLLPVVFFVLAAAAPLVHVPVLDVLLGLTPYSYVGHHSTFKILFTIGIISVPPFIIGWILYLFVGIILTMLLKKAYRSS